MFISSQITDSQRKRRVESIAEYYYYFTSVRKFSRNTYVYHYYIIHARAEKS